MKVVLQPDCNPLEGPWRRFDEAVVTVVIVVTVVTVVAVVDVVDVVDVVVIDFDIVLVVVMFALVLVLEPLAKAATCSHFLTCRKSNCSPPAPTL